MIANGAKNLAKIAAYTPGNATSTNTSNLHEPFLDSIQNSYDLDKFLAQKYDFSVLEKSTMKNMFDMKDLREHNSSVQPQKDYIRLAESLMSSGLATQPLSIRGPPTPKPAL